MVVYNDFQCHGYSFPLKQSRIIRYLERPDGHIMRAEVEGKIAACQTAKLYTFSVLASSFTTMRTCLEKHILQLEINVAGKYGIIIIIIIIIKCIYIAQCAGMRHSMQIVMHEVTGSQIHVAYNVHVDFITLYETFSIVFYLDVYNVHVYGNEQLSGNGEYSLWVRMLRRPPHDSAWVPWPRSNVV